MGDVTPIPTEKPQGSIQRVWEHPDSNGSWPAVRATIIHLATEDDVKEGYYKSEGFYWVVDVVSHTPSGYSVPERWKWPLFSGATSPLMECHDSHLEEVIEAMMEWIKMVLSASSSWWVKYQYTANVKWVEAKK